MKEIIVREYLESLKEDKELDFLFPMLLEVLGFQIITSPKEYKGYKQYGKDIIASGIDPADNVRKRFYFELKGGSDRDINAITYSKNDGIRMSIFEAKDRNFSDNSIKGFNDLPIKIVIAHNGVLKPDIRETFDDFVNYIFPIGGEIEFERWDISKLTQLFSEHLFGEYLLTNEENIRLFKRMLVFMDVPENSQRDFYVLVESITSNAKKIKIKNNYLPVQLIRFFETLKLISLITHQYAREVKNLEISKKCISYLVLKTWRWILLNNLETNSQILAKFNEILNFHKNVIQEYFEKLLPVAQIQFGLFSETGGKYEQVGFPLRCMDFLKYLNYWFIIVSESELSTEKKNKILTTVISANEGTYRPLLDNHSIAIVLTLKFYLENGFYDNAKTYLINVFEYIVLGKSLSNRLPDGKNNPESLIRLIVKREKSIYYEDRGSMLIGTLFEVLAVLQMKNEYNYYKEKFKDLQLSTFIPYSDELLKMYLPEVNISHEEVFFEKELYQEGYQSEIRLDENFEDFVEKTKNKNEYSIKYRTENAGYAHLIYLAHIFYETPFFPNIWRSWLESEGSQKTVSGEKS